MCNRTGKLGHNKKNLQTFMDTKPVLSMKFFALAAFLFFLCCETGILASEAFLPEQDWLQIRTQNAGSLSLPRGWDVVSQDEPAEQSPDADVIYNVQQALYARTVENSADNQAVLQVFSIWGADKEGKVLPLPADILNGASGDFVAGLIDARYGNVAKLAQDLIKTDLEDLSVATYGVDISPSETGRMEGALRYKCASLFYGEKMVLVLVRYIPDYEEYWHGQFESLLNDWVASLTLTPQPIAEKTKIQIALPEELISVGTAKEPPYPVMPLSGDGIASGAAFFVSTFAPAVEPLTVSSLPLAIHESPDISIQPVSVMQNSPAAAGKNPTSSFLLYAGAALLAFVSVFLFWVKFADWRTRKREDSLSMDLPESTSKEADVPIAEKNTVLDANPSPFSEEEEKQTALIKTEPLEMETFSFHSEEHLEEGPFIPLTKENEDFQENTRERETDVSRAYELIPTEDFEFQSSDDSDVGSEDFTSEAGFDRVYSLLNQALNSIESPKVLAPAFLDAASEPKTSAAVPNLKETIDVWTDLENTLGSSFVLDTLKNEILKTLELKEGTPPILQTRDVPPDCFVLKLCCEKIADLLQTGRYHIEKGILSNEGQELLDLFEKLSDLRVRKSYSTYEEARKDVSFIQNCVKKTG